MQGTGLAVRSQKSFADVMAEQLAEQQNMFVDGNGALDRQATLSFSYTTVRDSELREETTTSGTDLFDEKDYVMSNGIQAVMKRHRAYQQMYGSKPVSSIASSHYSSAASANVLPNDHNQVVTTSRATGSVSVQASIQQSAVRSVI
ncbi:MAG: hypothetical protein ACERJ1_03260 [Halodesulfovibrio sp.]|uniref:hypothetical protein n=1 Tax=Halodesulfovibrio sp. TaxID=1912772 RepID=UPI00359D593E